MFGLTKHPPVPGAEALDLKCLLGDTGFVQHELVAPMVQKNSDSHTPNTRNPSASPDTSESLSLFSGPTSEADFLNSDWWALPVSSWNEESIEGISMQDASICQGGAAETVPLVYPAYAGTGMQHGDLGPGADLSPLVCPAYSAELNPFLQVEQAMAGGMSFPGFEAEAVPFDTRNKPPAASGPLEARNTPVLASTPVPPEAEKPVPFAAVDVNSARFASPSGSPIAESGTSASALEARSSHNVKLHRCPICLKNFKRPSSFRIHYTTHTGIKQFQCKYSGCGKKFNVKSNMTRHQKLHVRRKRG